MMAATAGAGSEEGGSKEAKEAKEAGLEVVGLAGAPVRAVEK